MNDTTTKAREHYSASGLTGRIQSALTKIAPEVQALTIAQLAQLDRFYPRGILATADLAEATRIMEGQLGVETAVFETPQNEHAKGF